LIYKKLDNNKILNNKTNRFLSVNKTFFHNDNQNIEENKVFAKKLLFFEKEIEKIVKDNINNDYKKLKQENKDENLIKLQSEILNYKQKILELENKLNVENIPEELNNKKPNNLLNTQNIKSLENIKIQLENDLNGKISILMDICK